MFDILCFVNSHVLRLLEKFILFGEQRYHSWTRATKYRYVEHVDDRSWTSTLLHDVWRLCEIFIGSEVWTSQRKWWWSPTFNSSTAEEAAASHAFPVRSSYINVHRRNRGSPVQDILQSKRKKTVGQLFYSKMLISAHYHFILVITNPSN